MNQTSLSPHASKQYYVRLKQNLLNILKLINNDSIYTEAELANCLKTAFDNEVVLKRSTAPQQASIWKQWQTQMRVKVRAESNMTMLINQKMKKEEKENYQEQITFKKEQKEIHMQIYQKENNEKQIGTRKESAEVISTNSEKIFDENEQIQNRNSKNQENSTQEKLQETQFQEFEEFYSQNLEKGKHFTKQKLQKLSQKTENVQKL